MKSLTLAAVALCCATAAHAQPHAYVAPQVYATPAPGYSGPSVPMPPGTPHGTPSLWEQMGLYTPPQAPPITAPPISMRPTISCTSSRVGFYVYTSCY